MLFSQFCSNFFQEGRINLIPFKDCHIFPALPGDIYFVHCICHIAIWLYDHILAIWQYSYIAIWPKCLWYGCLLKEEQKCSNLPKELCWYDISGRNEREKWFDGQFSFFRISLCIRKKCWPPKKIALKLLIPFALTLLCIKSVICLWWLTSVNFGAFWDTLRNSLFSERRFSFLFLLNLQNIIQRKIIK